MGNTFEAPIVIDIVDTVISSMQPTPEDHVQFEKEQLETEDNFVFDFSDDEDEDAAFF